MKVRNGWVSNSSTSSYIVCGWKYPYPKTEEEYCTFLSVVGNPGWEDMLRNKTDNCDIIDIIDEIFEEAQYQDHEFGDVLIGKDDCAVFIGNITSCSSEVPVEEESLESWEKFLKPIKPGIDEEVESNPPKIFKVALNY